MTEALTVVAALLVLMGGVNLFFVRDGLVWYRLVKPASPLLFALLGIELVVWLISVFIGYVALRVILGLPPLPFNGLGVAVAILVLELIPLFIWLQMKKFVDKDRERDVVRDNARDLARDEIRDPARDLVRDDDRDKDPENAP